MVGSDLINFFFFMTLLYLLFCFVFVLYFFLLFHLFHLTHFSLAGGAYLFSPTGPAAPLVNSAQISAVNGKFVKTLYQDFVAENCLDPWEQIACGVSQYFS
jgi:hypothetical protein